MDLRKDVYIMKFKEFLKSFFLNVKDGVSRFLPAFICTVLAFFTVSFVIIFEKGSDEIIIPLCMAYALTAVLSVLLKTIQEYITEKLKPVFQYIISAVAGILTFILTYINYESLYMIMAYIGVVIALLCFIFYVIMRGENRDIAFPKLVSSWVFAGAICAVLSGGLSTCIFAVQLLLYSWDSIFKLYLIVNLFVWIICFVNIFISFIPKKDVSVPQSKIFRIFALFAGLPLYMLLIGILLLYLAKIVITWNMPVGEINWFASFASLFFIFFLLSVMQYKEKLATWFTKFGGYFLFPILIMQAIAVFERINAYGLTTPRTVSLVLIVISILFIIGSLVIPKHLNKIALASGIIVLIVTITPFNVIDMPIASQTNILKTVLTENNMIVNGKVVPGSNVSKEDQEKIISAYDYLKYDADNIPDFIEDSKKDFKEIFGFPKYVEDYNYNYNTNYTYCIYSAKNSIDIAGYNKMIYIDSNIDSENPQYNIDIRQIAQNLYDLYGEEKEDLDLYIIDENTALYITRLRIDIRNEEITGGNLSGYVLTK